MAVTNVKTYQEFRGVDYSASPAVISDEHASDMLNMYIGEDGVMQKRPGWHILKTFLNVDAFDATATYTVGQYVKCNNKFYKCIHEHTGVWDEDDFEEGVPPRLPINGLHYVQYRPGMGMLFIHAGSRLYGTMFVTGASGDVSQSGKVTAADAALIFRYLRGLVDFTPVQQALADVNNDGRITEDDAAQILRRVVGLEPFPDGLCGILADSYFRVTYSDGTPLELNNDYSLSFEHDKNLYILDGVRYVRLVPTKQQYTGETPSGSITLDYISSVYAEAVEGYIPTTGVNGHYEYDELNDEGTNTPGGEDNPGVWVEPTDYEDRNLLTPKQINTFTADGIHDTFYLNQNNCTVNKVEILTKTKCKSVNGKDVPDENGTYYAEVWIEVPAANYTVAQADDETEGEFATSIKFSTMPEASEKVNIRVTFEPHKHNSEWAVTKDRGYIEKCTVMTRFGYFNNNRIWLAGNPDHRNMDFMSGVDDPTYFPNTGWTKIGSDLTAIMGYLHYGSELAIIKEDNNQDATVYMRSAVLTDDNKIIFPVQQGAQGVGAVSKYCLKTLKDEPLFLAKEGVYAIQGTDASQERTIPNRSFYIDKKLKPEIEPCCVADVFQNYYFVCNPSTGHMFVADARYQGLPPGTNDRHRVYEWYRWDNVPARVLFATDDYLFFGTIDGRLCAFSFDWDNAKRWRDGAEFKEGSTILHKWNPYDGGYPINAYYVTKRDHLDALDFKKTMLNDGGVIALKPHEQSSASITVTTDKGSWFVEQVFTNSDEPSVVIQIRHRFKNFDSIETRIENNEMDEGLSILGLQYRYAITTNRR